jgi:hypothetical protein
MFVRCSSQSGEKAFEYLDWHPVLPDGFLVRTRYHFELTDESRADAIKKAHDLGASLVELHSHCGSWPASFSGSDLLGFEEFVPHVQWRLHGRPYLAIVVSRAGFDGLVWLSASRRPIRLKGIAVGRSVLKPTQLSPLEYDADGQ